jgi:UDP-N-acetylglucosamine transferase subunit ALG13
VAVAVNPTLREAVSRKSGVKMVQLSTRSPQPANGARRPRPRLCLAASGGGHLRQLLDLEPVWSKYDYFFLTEDTGLGQSLADRGRTYFVPHVALGQARLGAPLQMAWSGFRSLIKSARIIFKERPDFLISTGAGSMFFAVVWARLLGARIILVESFARFQSLSAFARMAGFLAHHKVVQSAAIAQYWPDAAVFDPMRLLDRPRPPKKALLFATVGATLPFDRLVDSVAQLSRRGLIPERIIIQNGKNGLAPDGMETHETLPFDTVLATLRDADIVVCHGGTGSLITALREGCRVVAMPRQFARAEHYDDHQSEITRAFADRGLIEIADSVEDLVAALDRVRARPPVVATSDPTELMSHLQDIISNPA